MTSTAVPRSRDRQAIPDAYKWRLEDIYPDWNAWAAGVAELEAGIPEYAALKGTLAQGPDRLLAALRLNDRLGAYLEENREQLLESWNEYFRG